MSQPALDATAPRRRSAALPGLCAICHGWARGRFCADCLAATAAPRPRCRCCAIGVPAGASLCGRCLRAPPPFDRAVAAVDYAAPWSHLVTRYKFHDGLDLADGLADRLADTVRADDAPLPDLVLPAPLAPQRLRERGWNQSWELARRVAPRLGVRADATLLLRIRATPHQVDLPLDERVANVRDAFAVEPLRRHEVPGLRIAVVDDVLTTGATMAEMARTLRAAGAASVHAWVLARTPDPGAA